MNPTPETGDVKTFIATTLPIGWTRGLCSAPPHTISSCALDTNDSRSSTDITWPWESTPAVANIALSTRQNVSPSKSLKRSICSITSLTNAAASGVSFRRLLCSLESDEGDIENSQTLWYCCCPDPKDSRNNPDPTVSKCRSSPG